MEKREKKDISGLVFFIQMSCLYILDVNGDISFVNTNERILNEIKINLVYEIQNLLLVKKDQNNCIFYETTDQTKFIKIENTSDYKKYAIIKLIILDEINSTKAKIKVGKKKISIIKQFQFFSSYKDSNSNYYLEEFNLNINEKEPITFKIFVYKGEINNINCGLKGNNKNKCYEIIFMAKNENSLPKELAISGYTIREFDKFTCSNRLRFNVMNVSKDYKFYFYNDNISSYEIIYLINEYNKITRYGVFNVASAKEITQKEFIIDAQYSKLVQKFWDEYENNKINNIINSNFFKKKNNELETKLKSKRLAEFKELRLLNVSDYTEQSLNRNESFIFFRNYSFFMFCEYIRINSLNHFKEYFDLLNKIENYSNFIKIRILLAFIYLIYSQNSFPTLIDINDLIDIHPYKLATKLQKDIIENMNEKSNIFYPIIQINSKILECLSDNLFDYLILKIKLFLNIKIKQKLAHTISLENINDMKTHLKNLQEDFFFIFDLENHYEFYGLYLIHQKIMVINQYLLCKNVSTDYDDIEDSKNIAFSINMVFSHERMCHGKHCLCNPSIISPSIYFNIQFKKDYISSYSKYNENEGESGRMFETFIAPKFLIKFMKERKSFGYFLEYKYFIRDFGEIKNGAMKVFKRTYFYKNYKRKKFIMIIFSAIIISTIFYYFKNYYDINKYIILYILLILLISYKYYSYENFKNLDIDNYDKVSKEYIDDIKVIFPDDYPYESETFLGRYLTFLECRKNRIRRRLKKYLFEKYV